MRRPGGRAADKAHRDFRRADRQGQLRPFHAEGSTSSGGHRRHLARAAQPVERGRGAAAHVAGPDTDQQADLGRLRHLVPRGAGRPILVRAHCPHTDGSRYRLEFRYRGSEMPVGGAAIFISAVGGTADALAAMAFAQAGSARAQRRQRRESSMCRQADSCSARMPVPEIGGTISRPSPTQLTVLACLVIAFAAKAPLRSTGKKSASSAPGAHRGAQSRQRGSQSDQRIAEIARTWRRATCFTSAAAPAFRSPWKAR